MEAEANRPVQWTDWLLAIDPDAHPEYTSLMSNTTMTFAAYIPVVPQSGTQAPAPVRVADFDPGVIAGLTVLLLGLVLLSRGSR